MSGFSANNGGPALDETPSYEALSRMGRACHGPHWEGKIAEAIGESPRTLRRWRDGEGSPGPRTMAWCRQWALRTAADLLAAAGEADLAGDVRDRMRSLDRRAVEKGRDAFLAARAQSPVEN